MKRYDEVLLATKNGRNRAMEITEVPAGKDLEIAVESEQISQIQRISRKSIFLFCEKKKKKSECFIYTAIFNCILFKHIHGNFKYI